MDDFSSNLYFSVENPKLFLQGLYLCVYGGLHQEVKSSFCYIYLCLSIHAFSP